MLEERRQRWMQDLRNRQRNIVFPDTVLNEARGFRNILSWSTKPGPLLRFCMAVTGLSILFPMAFMLREGIDALRSLEGWGLAFGMLVALGAGCLWGPLAYLGFRLFMEGVMPSPPGRPAIEAARPLVVPGIIRRPFSQRPKRRQIKSKTSPLMNTDKSTDDKE